MTVVKMIVACDEEGGIGRNNGIPWVCKEDMGYFRRTTIGHGKNAVIMGRNTYESLPLHFLPRRDNVVLSRTLERNEVHPNVSISKNITEALERTADNEEVWVIGGSEVYSALLSNYQHLIEEIHITRIKGSYSCDTFFSTGNIEMECYKSEQLNEHTKVEIMSPKGSR